MKLVSRVRGKRGENTCLLVAHTKRVGGTTRGAGGHVICVTHRELRGRRRRRRREEAKTDGTPALRPRACFVMVGVDVDPHEECGRESGAEVGMGKGHAFLHYSSSLNATDVRVQPRHGPVRENPRSIQAHLDTPTPKCTRPRARFLPQAPNHAVGGHAHAKMPLCPCPLWEKGRGRRSVAHRLSSLKPRG